MNRTMMSPSGTFCRSRPTTILLQRSRHGTANGFRPRQLAAPIPLGRRSMIVAKGDEGSGHILAGPNEGIMFFDNVFPLKLQGMFQIPGWHTEDSVSNIMKRFNNPNIAAADPLKIIKRAIPPKAPVKINEIIPRLNDGGAFVKFSHDPALTVREIEGTLKEYLTEQPIQPWFNPFARVTTFMVKGQPWLEDMYRLPSSKLKVEFVSATPGGEAIELSQEDLYSLFRRYGKIKDIETQPSDSKILPKYAYLNFGRVRHGIMAKNCMHGFELPEASGGGKSGTELRISYEKRAKAHWIRDWIFGHPRITLPIIAAFVATITVAIFDPIRTFFVESHITRVFSISDNVVYRWFAAQADGLIGTFGRHNRQEAGLAVLWDDRKDDIQQLQTWLLESADTFIVVQGPRGSGKKELVVDQALKGRKNTLVIDCKPVQEARGDSNTILKTALQVGYRPVFPWMNTVSSLVDLAAQGTIGTKTGFSETLDSQLNKIFQTTSAALRKIGLEGRKKDDKDSALGDDEYLDAHPERRPVVVIDNFLHKSQESNLVYDKMAEWAASLTTTNSAHVIFLTHDVSFSKSLSKALPDRVFRQISLGDCSPQVAKRFVINHLDADPDDVVVVGEKRLTPSMRREDLGELDTCIEDLGGRLTDLEFLARRMKSGETPKKAVQEIIEQSASEILKMYLLDVDRASRTWTPEQAWLLIKSLAKDEPIRYNEILLSDTFKTGDVSGEKTLQSLESAELIAINSVNGRPHSIKPGKPVYQAAFKLLTEDQVLKSRLDLAILSELATLENATIAKAESELSLLGSLPGQGKEVIPRVKYLLAKLSTSQQKVEQYEAKSARLKKVLQVEF